MSPGRGSEALQNYGPQLIAMIKAEFSNYHRKGELYIPDTAPQIIALPTGGSFVKVTGFTAGESSGAGHVVLDAANGTITIGDQGEGLYKIWTGMSFAANKVGEVHGSIFVNNSELTKVGFHEKITNINSSGDANQLGYSRGVLVPGDVIDVRVTHDQNTVNLTIDHCNFHITWSAGE